MTLELKKVPYLWPKVLKIPVIIKNSNLIKQDARLRFRNKLAKMLRVYDPHSIKTHVLYIGINCISFFLVYQGYFTKICCFTRTFFTENHIELIRIVIFSILYIEYYNYCEYY